LKTIKLDTRFSKLVAWRRKMPFLRKIMKQYEREKSNEKNDVWTIRTQLTRIVSSMKALENVVRWMINMLSQFLRFLFNTCKRVYLIASLKETSTTMSSTLSKRSKTLARSHHDRFSLSNKEKESRNESFARKSQTWVEFEVKLESKLELEFELELFFEKKKKQKKKKKKKNVEQINASRQLQVQISIIKIFSRDRFFKQKK
jgi:hypothetical protein